MAPCLLEVQPSSLFPLPLVVTRASCIGKQARRRREPTCTAVDGATSCDPTRRGHCYECQVCVDDLDHHCPWTGKCIGKRTLFFFHAFLICLSVHILFVVVGAIVVFAVK